MDAKKNKSSAPSVKSVNPFDELDCKLHYYVDLMSLRNTVV